MELIYAQDEYGNSTDTVVARQVIASQQMARDVVDAPVGTDGRSQWMWIRLASGDLILGCYPSGELFFKTQIDHNRI